MLNWLKKQGGDSTHWRNSGYPAGELEWLEKDFSPLDVLRAGICEEIMQFIATGEVESVLQTLTGMRAASGALSLRCRNNGGRPTPDRDRFFTSTTILAVRLQSLKTGHSKTKPTARRMQPFLRIKRKCRR